MTALRSDCLSFGDSCVCTNVRADVPPPIPTEPLVFMNCCWMVSKLLSAFVATAIMSMPFVAVAVAVPSPLFSSGGDE